jgi:hypothetical protein
MLRLWLIRALPALGRWLDLAPAACCGGCPTCVGTAVGGMTLEVLRDAVGAGARKRWPPPPSSS